MAVLVTFLCCDEAAWPNLLIKDSISSGADNSWWSMAIGRQVWHWKRGWQLLLRRWHLNSEYREVIELTGNGWGF